MTLEQKVARLWDIQQIKNLMGSYALYHNGNEHMKTVEMFDLDREDVWLECGDLGIYKGPEGIKKFFYDWHLSLTGDPHGALNEHLLTSEVIEVAEDGKTAKAVWISPGVETRRTRPSGELEAIWIWGKYYVEFIRNKEGEWKFWHFTITQDFNTDYHHSWVETEKTLGARVINQGIPQNDGPALNPDDGYQKDKVFTLSIPVPKPYKSYEGV